ncbi:MarR family winged helix-turn-helix transcriptional regulator [Salinibacterium soli]|uniref:MarR family winged helix-turn-helix transcriptional regulator n=1 Tax=Antiquaquibacter soli TaxID=3064523 RepID=A0ABT9BN80_9MICO|nr:MarR family winged helix-turn-helix transcriptional regulator [Protaetiibacter sp. WY-16]MDO7882486.1 MarR family winged helix-turn-helix transcriptional regulator [Protaetiibacter sp. WY-16]
MTTQPEDAPFRPRPPVRRPTELIREFLDVSEDFEAHVGRELTVNPTDLQAMQHLIMEGPLGPTELSRRLGISTAATTAVVDRLVAVGHARRTQHPSDRRGIVIVPEPASVERAMATLMPMIMGIDGVLDEFEPDEQEVITAYLERVLEVFRAQLPEPPTTAGGPGGSSP